MPDPSKPFSLSRRNLLAGLATMPALLVDTGSCGAQTGAAEKAQSALKNASGTKLVMLGTGAGPNPTIPGRTRYMTAHVMLSNASAYILDCGLGVINQFARNRNPVYRCSLDLHYPSSSRSQYRVWSVAPHRLGARRARIAARLWPTPTQADD